MERALTSAAELLNTQAAIAKLDGGFDQLVAAERARQAVGAVAAEAAPEAGSVAEHTTEAGEGGPEEVAKPEGNEQGGCPRPRRAFAAARVGLGAVARDLLAVGAAPAQQADAPATEPAAQPAAEPIAESVIQAGEAADQPAADSAAASIAAECPAMPAADDSIPLDGRTGRASRQERAAIRAGTQRAATLPCGRPGRLRNASLPQGSTHTDHQATPTAAPDLASPARAGASAAAAAPAEAGPTTVTEATTAVPSSFDAATNATAIPTTANLAETSCSARAAAAGAAAAGADPAAPSSPLTFASPLSQWPVPPVQPPEQEAHAPPPAGSLGDGCADGSAVPLSAICAAWGLTKGVAKGDGNCGYHSALGKHDAGEEAAELRRRTCEHGLGQSNELKRAADTHAWATTKHGRFRSRWEQQATAYEYLDTRLLPSLAACLERSVVLLTHNTKTMNGGFVSDRVTLFYCSPAAPRLSCLTAARVAARAESDRRRHEAGVVAPPRLSASLIWSQLSPLLTGNEVFLLFEGGRADEQSTVSSGHFSPLLPVQPPPHADPRPLRLPGAGARPSGATHSAAAAPPALGAPPAAAAAAPDVAAAALEGALILVKALREDYEHDLRAHLVAVLERSPKCLAAELYRQLDFHSLVAAVQAMHKTVPAKSHDAAHADVFSPALEWARSLLGFHASLPEHLLAALLTVEVSVGQPAWGALDLDKFVSGLCAMHGGRPAAQQLRSGMQQQHKQQQREPEEQQAAPAPSAAAAAHGDGAAAAAPKQTTVVLHAPDASWQADPDEADALERYINEAFEWVEEEAISAQPSGGGPLRTLLSLPIPTHARPGREELGGSDAEGSTGGSSSDGEPDGEDEAAEENGARDDGAAQKRRRSHRPASIGDLVAERRSPRAFEVLKSLAEQLICSKGRGRCAACPRWVGGGAWVLPSALAIAAATRTHALTPFWEHTHHLALSHAPALPWPQAFGSPAGQRPTSASRSMPPSWGRSCASTTKGAGTSAPSARMANASSVSSLAVHAAARQATAATVRRRRAATTLRPTRPVSLMARHSSRS